MNIKSIENFKSYRKNYLNTPKQINFKGSIDSACEKVFYTESTAKTIAKFYGLKASYKGSSAFDNTITYSLYKRPWFFGLLGPKQEKGYAVFNKNGDLIQDFSLLPKVNIDDKKQKNFLSFLR